MKSGDGAKPVPSLSPGDLSDQLPRHDSIILPVKFWIIANVTEMAATAQGTTEQPYATVFSQMILSPFPIREPGMLKVRAVRGDRLIKLGALRIKAADQPQFPAGIGD